MIFYINIDGLSRQEAERNLSSMVEAYDMKDVKSFNVKTMWIPVKDQQTKVEIINPKLVNGDIIKAFKNLVDTLDNDQYRDLVNNL